MERLISRVESPRSFTDKARMNIKFDHRLKRNVLEIEVAIVDENEDLDLEIFGEYWN